MKKTSFLSMLLAVMMSVLCVGCAANATNNNEKDSEAASETTVSEQTINTTEGTTEEIATTAEATSETNSELIRIASLKGPTSMGLAKLYTDSDAGLTNNQYEYQISGTADEIVTQIVKGDIDVAAVPANLASVLVNKTEGEVMIAAVNTLGVLYMLAKGEELSSISDLKGKTIYATGEGTTPEYTLRYILTKNGLDPDTDVDIQYLAEATEVVAKAGLSENVIMMLPQPYVMVAMGNVEGLSIAFDLSKEWAAVDSESSAVTGTVVVRKEFVDEHAAAFQAFMEEYKASVDYVNNNVEEASLLIEQLDIFKAAIAKKAIPYCNITFLTGEEMKSALKGYLEVLFSFNPKSVGGALPTDENYYVN